MLEYNRIDISEGIDVNKNKNFKYGPYLCDGCYDMSMKANSMQNLAIVYHGEYAYCVIFVFMIKKDAVNLIKNAVIIDKKGTL